MTRLIVAPEADDDASEILSYLDREAGPRIAEYYGRRFRHTLTSLVALPQTGAPRPNLGRDTRVAIVQPLSAVLRFYRGRRHRDPAAHSPWQAKHHQGTFGPLMRGT
jgi:plasmid stabilization system protein ParE